MPDAGDAEIDDLAAAAWLQVAEQPLMLALEAGADGGGIERRAGHCDRRLLARVAHVERHRCLGGSSFEPLPGQRVPRRRGERCRGFAQRVQVVVVETTKPALHMVLADIGVAHAEGAEDAGEARHIHGAAAQRSRYRGAMQGAGTPTGDEGEAPWIVAVDACIGGFLTLFAAALGHPVPTCDFRAHGVTSLSADIHKYGMAAKGASVLLLRDAALKRHHGFEFDGWPRGVYATETFSGSRPAGAIAAAWAVMRHLGHAGYVENARIILDTWSTLAAGIAAIPGLEVIRPAELCMLLYRSTDPALDLDALAERLGVRGWFVGRNVKPKAIHLALNTVHASSADACLADLRAAVAEVRDAGLRGTADLRTY